MNSAATLTPQTTQLAPEVNLGMIRQSTKCYIVLTPDLKQWKTWKVGCRTKHRNESDRKSWPKIQKLYTEGTKIKIKTKVVNTDTQQKNFSSANQLFVQDFPQSDRAIQSKDFFSSPLTLKYELRTDLFFSYRLLFECCHNVVITTTATGGKILGFGPEVPDSKPIKP